MRLIGYHSLARSNFSIQKSIRSWNTTVVNIAFFTPSTEINVAPISIILICITELLTGTKCAVTQ